MRFPHAGIYLANASADVARSSLTRILTYIEQGNRSQLVDFTLAANVLNNVTTQRIAIDVCPSEIQDVGKPATATKGPASINRWPLNYAANVGTWMTWNPKSVLATKGRTLTRATPNGGNRVADFTDGLSNTVGYSEVKADTWGHEIECKPTRTFPNTTTVTDC